MDYIKGTTKIDYLGYFDPHYLFFLVIETGQGYILNCWEGKISFLCPCCMSTFFRERINQAVEQALANGDITGKATWVCKTKNMIKIDPSGPLVPEYTTYGDNISENPGLKGELFQAGREDAISPETLIELKRLALLYTEAAKKR
ncbi:MAG: hypothetical protein PHC70_00380 [Patescibacteria group bacterium]|nr:hypothetical protein [Patescibacteria group bacterium]